jgi:hypothetical protein
MKKIIISICTCLAATFCFSQINNSNAEFNFGFEKNTSKGKLPDKWFQWGSGYSLTVDTLVQKSGKYSVLIEPVGEKSPNTFGCVAYAIPAQYKGTEIEVKAYMKLNNVENGSIGLMLRIDGESGSLGFDNMQQKNIHGTSDWTLYAVKLPYSEKAKTIYIGALLSGTGQLWVDEFQVLIDGKNISDVKPDKRIFKADGDKEFDKGSTISSVVLSKTKTEDLDVLGKVWGYLKYYHPAVASGEYHWDYELFRILPKILEAKSPKERNQILHSWVATMGKVDIEKTNPDKNKNVKLNPDFTWLDKNVLGKELASQLETIKNAKRTQENYYLGMVPGVGNPEFKNERSYAGMKYPDAGFRLLSLYRYWNIIHYYFPYKHLIEENWNDVLKEFIPKFLEASDELQYKQTVLTLIARVHDTHANIWGQDNVLRNFLGIYYAPFKISFIEQKAVVTEYLDKDLGERSGLKVGDVIEMINDTPVEKIVKQRLPYTPASNYPTQLRNISYNLLRANDSLMTLVYSRDNEKSSKQVPTVNSEKLARFKKNERDTCFKVINSDISYLYPGTLQGDHLEKILPEILKTKGLIIDLRCYPKTFIVFSLSEYLLPAPTSFVKFSVGSITSPGLFTMTNDLKVGKTNNDFYKGKVVIIVNETTQSQAEYHAMAFRAVPHATVIGSTTAGADGNVSGFTLPGGISTMISGIGVYYPDGKETQRIGIVPDVEVRPTIKGIREGKDELLEKAIEIINMH